MIKERDIQVYYGKRLLNSKENSLIQEKLKEIKSHALLTDRAEKYGLGLTPSKRKILVYENSGRIFFDVTDYAINPKSPEAVPITTGSKEFFLKGKRLEEVVKITEPSPAPYTYGEYEKNRK